MIEEEEEEVSFLASQASPQLQPLLQHQHQHHPCNFCNTSPHPPPIFFHHQDPEDPPSPSSNSLGASSAVPFSCTSTSRDTQPSSSSSASHPNGRNKIHRCKTAPAMTVMRDLKPHNSNPDSSASSLVRQAFLLLLIYLSLGILIFSFNRPSFSGHRTHPVVDALYFCIVTMCTIGYGDISPISPAAKLFACLFVLVGFGFIDILLSGVVNHVIDLQEKVILKEAANKSKSKSGARNYIVDVEKGRMRIRLKVGLALGIVVLCIGIGTVVLYFGEGLDLIDSVYLSVMSVTTVGYGDRAFKTLHGRVFASIWLLFSTLAVARAFLYLAEARIDKRHRRIAKWVLHRDITVDDLLKANLNNNAFISKSEYVVYKLKEMGKIREKDVMEICEQFNKLDRNNSGKITLPDLLQDHHHQPLFPYS